MIDSTDDNLMLEIQKGNQAACQTLVEQHLPALRRFAVRLLGNTSEAEDALQETFLRVWTRANQWQPGRSKLTTWLHRIMHNICIDYLRKKGPWVEEPLTEHHRAPQNLEQEQDVSSQTHRVFKAMQMLPERQRTAIILCYYQGFSNQETAEILGVSVSALESLLARGRRTLREQLLGEAV